MNARQRRIPRTASSVHGRIRKPEKVLRVYILRDHFWGPCSVHLSPYQHVPPRAYLLPACILLVCQSDTRTLFSRPPSARALSVLHSPHTRAQLCVLAHALLTFHNRSSSGSTVATVHRQVQHRRPISITRHRGTASLATHTGHACIGSNKQGNEQAQSDGELRAGPRSSHRMRSARS